jgi:hypothetical protein
MIFKFRLKPGKTTLILMLIVAFLVAASLIGQYSTYFLGDGHMQGFVPEFNLDREMNVRPGSPQYASCSSPCSFGSCRASTPDLRANTGKG